MKVIDFRFIKNNDISVYIKYNNWYKIYEYLLVLNNIEKYKEIKIHMQPMGFIKI